MIRSIYSPLLLLYFGFIGHAFIIAYGDSQQCGSVMVSWARRADPAVQFQYPFYLYIVPFSDTAVIQEIDNWNASTPFGSTLMNFSLPASTSYILGVVDSQGRGVGSSSQVLVTQNSTNTSCLSPQSRSQSQSQSQSRLLSEFQVLPTTQPSDCPTLTLSFNPPDQPPRALIFTPGEHPTDIITTSTPFQSGLVRVRGLPSLSQFVVVYQANASSPAYTSSLMTVGGADFQCGTANNTSGASSIPDALKGGSVIGYVFASVFITGLITTSVLYVYNLRVETMKLPFLPPKEPFIISLRRITLRDKDLELALSIPLPKSTDSLVVMSPTGVMKRDSFTSATVPGVPNSTPITAHPSSIVSDLNNTEETTRPIVRHQQSESVPDLTRVSPIAKYQHLSPSSHSVGTKRSSHVPQKKRQSDASVYPQSTRPSTFVSGSGTRESGTLEPFEEAMVARYIPRPDSPTLPDIAMTSPFHFNFDITRSSKSSSKKSEKRSVYMKMNDPIEEVSEEGGISLVRRRARSLSRSRSNSSRKTGKKKARSVPR